MLPSLAYMKVLTRVMSAWKARTIRSNIRRMCSLVVLGDAVGTGDAVEVGVRPFLGAGDPDLQLADGRSGIRRACACRWCRAAGRGRRHRR